MPSKLIRSFYNIKPAQQGGVLTIGNFDGVHRGHQQLIAQVVNKAAVWHVPAIVMTFEPQPAEFFSRGQSDVPRLTRLREKYTALAHCGVDYVFIVYFNQSLADLSAPDFINRIATYLRPKHIIIGDDFHFGRQRLGDFNLLQTMGISSGFSAECIPTITMDGKKISSTWVRDALAVGDHALVARLLNRPYAMMGRVRGGDQIGRQWGIPTANIYLHRQLTPVHGVYIVYMHGVAEHPWPGVANVGMRPTINGKRTLLEVHLLDFNQEIYGRYVTVDFCKKLREEVRYPNIDLLKIQIEQDIADARLYFQQQGVCSE